MALAEQHEAFKKLSPLERAESDIQLYANNFGHELVVSASIATLLTDTWMFTGDSAQRQQQISKALRRFLGEHLGLDTLVDRNVSSDQVQHAQRFLRDLEQVHEASSVATEYIAKLLRITESTSQSPAKKLSNNTPTII